MAIYGSGDTGISPYRFGANLVGLRDLEWMIAVYGNSLVSALSELVGSDGESKGFELSSWAPVPACCLENR